MPKEFNFDKVIAELITMAKMLQEIKVDTSSMAIRQRKFASVVKMYSNTGRKLKK